MPTKEEVLEVLRQVEDPELGMDVVDLGLVYDVEVEGPKVKVTHSLTSMGCPVGPLIQEDIDRVTRELPGVEDVELLQPRRLYEREARMDEYQKLVERFKRERVAELRKYPDLTEEIVRSVS